MAKQEDRFKMEGVVTEALRGSKFKVKLENGIECTCTLSGKLRQNFIRIIEGDKVTVDLSIKDPTLSNGRIIWRDKC
jgi:translation initiation factor IF-1